MTKKSQRDWLHRTGLLETLNFSRGQKVYWYQCIQNKRFVYSTIFSEGGLPSFKRCGDPT